MKKRLFVAFLAFTLVMGLGACGSSDEDKDPSNGQKPGIEDGLDEDEDTVTDDAIDSPEDGQEPEDEGSAGNTNKPSTPPATNKPSTNPPASGGSNTSKAPISGTFEEIIKNVYSKVGLDLNTGFTEVTSENAQYYLGVADIKFKKALASEPMMSSVAHSVVLLEVADGADIAAIKKSIKENVDGRKWICVGVEDEDILVGNVGNYIMLVMDEESQELMDAFLAMGK